MSAKIDPGIVCTYLYIISKEGYPPPAEKTGDHLADMQSLGFVSVELEGIRKEHLMGIYRNRANIADAIKRLGLQVPYFCTVLPGLSAPDEKIRRENLDHFEKGCEIAKLFGSRGVLDNAPLPPYLFPGDIPVVRHYGEAELRQAWLPADLSWPEYQDVLVSTFRTVCEISASYGLTYNMHPALGVLGATTDAFLNFYQALKMENLRFNLDTANQFFMKENLILALHRSIGYIDYIHLSDNGGNRVEHLPPGQGTIPWDRFFETLDLLGFRGHIGIDVGGEESALQDIGNAYRESAAWIAARWNKL